MRGSPHSPARIRLPITVKERSSLCRSPARLHQRRVSSGPARRKFERRRPRFDSALDPLRDSRFEIPVLQFPAALPRIRVQLRGWVEGKPNGSTVKYCTSVTTTPATAVAESDDKRRQVQRIDATGRFDAEYSTIILDGLEQVTPPFLDDFVSV